MGRPRYNSSLYPILLCFCCTIPVVYSATSNWTGAGANDFWTNAANWSGAVPGAGDTGVFDPNFSVNTTASNQGILSLASIEFAPGNTAYTVTTATAGSCTFTGAGIVNSSQVTQSILNFRGLNFTNNSDAGANVVINNFTAGIITFTGNSTAANTSIVNTGAGSINISGISGSSMSIGSISDGVITLGAKELIVGGLNLSTNLGLTSGSGGSLTKIGTGTLTLTGNNTYTGLTTISAGALSIGNGGTGGSVAGDILNNSILIFNRGISLAYSGIISGVGSLIKRGGSFVTLSGVNTFSGDVSVEAGILIFGNTNNIGTGNTINLSGGGTISPSASMTINRTFNLGTGNGGISVGTGQTLTLPGLITGSGGIVKTGAGTLVMTGNNNFSGTSTISAGIFSLGDGVTSSGAYTLSGNFVNNASIRVNSPDNLTLGGAISGTGTLVKQGAGTLTLSGTNSYSGTTTLSAGTLRIDNNANLGTGTLAINNSTLNVTGTASFTRAVTIASACIFDVDSAASLILGGVVSSTGSLVKNGSGLLALAAANSYSGGTTINAGSLSIGNGGTTGSVVGNIVNNANLIFNHSNNQTYSAIVSGSGSLTKQGAGTLTLSNSNTFSGDVAFNGGLVAVSNNNNLGVGTTLSFDGGGLQTTASLTNTRTITLNAGGGTFSPNTGTTLNLPSLISGTGGLTKSGAGALVLTANNNYSGTTTISAGSLSLGNGVTASGAYNFAGDFVNNSSLIINRPDDLTLSGTISGSGTITKQSNNTLTLAGNSSYSGQTIVSAGTLSISQDSNLGTGSLAINNSNLKTTGNVNSTRAVSITGTVNFDTDAGTGLVLGGVVSGTGALVKNGNGLLALAGANNYSGGTTINGGSLSLGNGGTSGSIAGNIVNNANLIFNYSASQSYSGIVSGSGTVTKTGAGTVTLSGNNTFAGNVALNGGLLAISNNNNLGLGTGLSFDGGGLETTTTLSNNRLISLNAGGGVFSPDASTSLTLTNLISGNGTLTKSGLGNLIFTANNNYTGLTNIDSGNLYFGNGGTSGSTSGDILNNSNLVFNRSDNATFANKISGTGTVTKIGNNTITLTGISDYTGITALDAGVIRIANGANLGNGGSINFNGGSLETAADLNLNQSLNLNNATGTIRTDAGTTATVDGQILGSSQLIKEGTGSLSLTNSLNSFTGGSLVLAGTLIGRTDTLPGDVTINSGGFLSFMQNADGSYNGIISGAGNVIKDGSGTVTLTGINTWNGEANIQQGALQVNSVVLNNNNVDTAANTALIFDEITNTSYAGVLSGAGALIKLGTGALTLLGLNTYSGGSFISQGSLVIDDDNKLGSVLSPLIFNSGILQTTANIVMTRATTFGVGGGTFDVQANTSLTLNGNVNGSGMLIKIGDGSLILNNASNNYSGGTVLDAGTLFAGQAGGFVNNVNYTVNNGTLDLNNFDLHMAGLQGSGGLVSVGSALLEINQAADTDYAGQLQGTATARMSKDGQGKLILSGDNSSFHGETTVKQGSLIINGTQGGSMVVENNGHLQGNGSIGPAKIYGHIAPGNSIGELTVNGSYTQFPGSIYEVEIGANSTADHIQVNGAANILGGTVSVLTTVGPYLPGAIYTILTATAGVSGRYNELLQPNLPFLDFELSYDANNVYLSPMRRADVRFFDLGVTANQRATAGAIETLQATNPLYIAVLNLPNAESAQQAYNLLSGEIHAAYVGAVQEDSQYLRNAILNRLSQIYEKNRFWLQGYGAKTEQEGNGNAEKLKTKNHGLFLGYDSKLSELAQIGVTAGSSRLDLQQNPRNASLDADTYHLAVYSGFSPLQQLLVKIGLGNSWYRSDSYRHVIFSNFDEQLISGYHLSQAQAFSEFAYTELKTRYHVEPFIQFAALKASTSGFQERQGYSALQSGKAHWDLAYTTLGSRYNWLWMANSHLNLSSDGFMGFRHAFGQTSPYSKFAFPGSTVFSIEGTPIAPNAWIVNAGFNVDQFSAHDIKLALQYAGEFATNLSNNGIILNARWKF